MALAAIRPKRILLMSYESEKIHRGSGGIDECPWCQRISESSSYISEVSGNSQPVQSGIKRLRKEYWNVLFGIGTPIEVGPLKPEAAQRALSPAQRSAC